MVEISTEQSMLITVVSFLSVFFILVMTMPTALLTSAPQYRTVTTPEYFEAVDIQSFAQTYNFSLSTCEWTSNTYLKTFNLGGWNLYFRAIPTHWIESAHYAQWWIFSWDFHYFEWYDKQGINYGKELELTELDSVFLTLNQTQPSSNMTIMEFTIKSDQTQLSVFFSWNHTQWGYPSNAINNGDFHILYCIGFDKINTSINAWNLVGMILFFQAPNIHPVLNAIIAIPIWVAIAYLIYIIILKAIPFVGG